MKTRKGYIMKINWKERLNNKTFILSLSGLIVTFIYQILALCFDFVPSVAREDVITVIGLIVNALALLGVIIDPTTKGINDSERAMTYGTQYDVRKKEGNDG